LNTLPADPTYDYIAVSGFLELKESAYLIEAKLALMDA